MDLEADSTTLRTVTKATSAPIPRRSRTKVLEVVPEMVAKINPATGKPVTVRNRRTRRLEKVMEPTGRWRLNGYYVGGERVRRFYPDETAAKADLERLQTEQGNVDARTRRVLANRNDLVQDAIRAHDVLMKHTLPVTLLEGVRDYAHCLTALKPYGASLRDVVAGYVAAEKARQKSIAIGELVKKVIADRERTGKSGFYVKDLGLRLRRFEEHFGSNTMVSDVTPAGVVEWLETLDVSPRTKNNFLRNVGAAFGFATKRGFIASNPFLAVDKAREQVTAPAVFTPKQMATLLEKADARLVPVLAIGAFAGLRPEELRRLMWHHVDFDAGLIEVEARHSKTAQRRLVTMSENLKAWLAPYRNARGKVAPVANRRLRQNGERMLREAAMKAAKIKTWPVDVLRHSFGSYHLAKHNDAAKTALEMGHTTTKTLFEHYRNLVKPEAATAFWSIQPAETAGNVLTFTKETAAA